MNDSDPYAHLRHLGPLSFTEPHHSVKLKADPTVLPGERWFGVAGFHELLPDNLIELGLRPGCQPRVRMRATLRDGVPRSSYILPQPADRTTGYRRVSVRVGSKRLNLAVHRLACHVVHGPCPKGHECAHGNGHQTDNRPENLRWATSAENSADAVEHGTATRGQQNGMAKLTDDDALSMRALAATGLATFAELGELWNVGVDAARRCVRGISFTNMPNSIPPGA